MGGTEKYIREEYARTVAVPLKVLHLERTLVPSIRAPPSTRICLKPDNGCCASLERDNSMSWYVPGASKTGSLAHGISFTLPYFLRLRHCVGCGSHKKHMQTPPEPRSSLRSFLPISPLADPPTRRHSDTARNEPDVDFASDFLGWTRREPSKYRNHPSHRSPGQGQVVRTLDRNSLSATLIIARIR